MTKISEEDLFEMDECMKPLIKLLNNRGYETTCCCSGHCKEDWNHPIHSQENFFCHKYSVGMIKKKYYNGKTNGLIWFKKKKDRDMILRVGQKTKYARRFITYFAIKNKRHNTKNAILLKTRCLTQKEIDKFWKDFTKRLKRVL